jgi:hypothetical protein
MPPFRIRRNVGKLVAEILIVSDAVPMESRLPYLPSELTSYRKLEAPLDALRATLDGLARLRRKKNMQMFRHDHEPMQEVAALVSVVEQDFQEQFGISSSEEQALRWWVAVVMAYVDMRDQRNAERKEKKGEVGHSAEAKAFLRG